MTVRNSIEPCDAAAMWGHVTGKVRKAFEEKAVNHDLSCKIRLRSNSIKEPPAVTALQREKKNQKHGEHNDELQQMNTLKVKRLIMSGNHVLWFPYVLAVPYIYIYIWHIWLVNFMARNTERVVKAAALLHDILWLIVIRLEDHCLCHSVL